MSKVTTYESLDDRIAPEALTEDNAKGLEVVDGHAVKDKNDLFRFIEIKTEIRNQDGVKVLRGSMKIGFLK